jgi:hypothetical protein
MRIRSTLAVFATSVAIVASAIAALPEASAATGVTGKSYPSMLQKIGVVTPTALATTASEVSATESAATELAVASKRLRPESEDFRIATSGTTTPPNAENLSVSSSTVRQWKGLTAFDSRYADGGNQGYGEPSDMAMCTNGSYVVQMVNSAIQIYSTSGTAALPGSYGALDSVYAGAKAYGLNQFFGYPHDYDRTTGEYGPSLYDVTCLYDATATRWFLVAAVLDVLPDGTYTGDNWVDVLTSSGSNPVTSSWTRYRLWTTNDGTHGTPDHGCTDINGVFPPNLTLPHQCFGDYPQIGLDQNGLYITTNEFEWWGYNFNGAQLYAIDKADLIAGNVAPDMTYFQNVYSDGLGYVTYTLQPANAVPSQMTANTMYFGMSWSPLLEPYTTDRFSVFTLSGTNNLGTATLGETVVTTSAPYAAPPAGQQRSGQTPTLDLYNSGYFGKYRKIAAPIPLSTGSGKFYGAWLSNGFLFFTTTSAASGSGGAEFGTQGTWTKVNERAAVAIFTVRATPTVATATATTRIVGVSGQNLAYPSVAVNAAGKGAIGATLVGPSYYPASVFIPIRVVSTGGLAIGGVSVARSGVGPNDGFSGWQPGYWRTRWGDYGTAAVDPATGNIWMASGYTPQQCALSTYQSDVTCNFTRNRYANWASAIYRYIP